MNTLLMFQELGSKLPVIIYAVVIIVIAITAIYVSSYFTNKSDADDNDSEREAKDDDNWEEANSGRGMPD